METALRLGKKYIRHPRDACAISHGNVLLLVRWCIFAGWTKPRRALVLTGFLFLCNAICHFMLQCNRAMCNTIKALRFSRFPNPVMCVMVCLFWFVYFNLFYSFIYLIAVADNSNNLQMALKMEIIHPVKCSKYFHIFNLFENLWMNC